MDLCSCDDPTSSFQIAPRRWASQRLLDFCSREEYAGTRADDNNPLGKVVQRIFGDEIPQTAMQQFIAAAKAENLTPNDVAVRWVVHHSALNDDDAVILGASKISQIRNTVESIGKGPLPAHLVKAADEMWESVKGTRGNML